MPLMKLSALRWSSLRRPLSNGTSLRWLARALCMRPRTSICAVALVAAMLMLIAPASAAPAGEAGAVAVRELAATFLQGAAGLPALAVQSERGRRSDGGRERRSADRGSGDRRYSGQRSGGSDRRQDGARSGDRGGRGGDSGRNDSNRNDSSRNDSGRSSGSDSDGRYADRRDQGRRDDGRRDGADRSGAGRRSDDGRDRYADRRDGDRSARNSGRYGGPRDARPGSRPDPRNSSPRYDRRDDARRADYRHQTRYAYGRRYDHGYRHGHGPRGHRHGYYCNDHLVFHYFVGYDPFGWRRAYHRGYYPPVGCYSVERIEYRRGRRVLVGAFVCFDAFGYPYVQLGSQYVLRYY